MRSGKSFPPRHLPRPGFLYRKGMILHYRNIRGIQPSAEKINGFRAPSFYYLICQFCTQKGVTHAKIFDFLLNRFSTGGPNASIAAHLTQFMHDRTHSSVQTLDMPNFFKKFLKLCFQDICGNTVARGNRQFLRVLASVWLLNDPYCLDIQGMKS